MSRVCHANALVKQASDWQTRSSRVRTGVGQTSPCCNDDSVLLSRHRCAGHTTLLGESCPARRLHPAKTFPTTSMVSESLGPRHMTHFNSGCSMETAQFIEAQVWNAGTLDTGLLIARRPGRGSAGGGRRGESDLAGGDALGRAGESEKLSSEHERINLEAARWAPGGVLSRRDLLRGGGCRILSK
jgi:hypothetical protein